MNTVNYKDARDKYFFIDVRSPSEFKEDTILGSVNIPLFNDEEREKIGTLYVQVGKDEAKRLGVNSISPKLPDMFEQILALKHKHNQLVAFCARGGYRSSFVTSAFSSIGIPITQLEGGYKSYRKEVIDSIPKLNDEVTYIVLSGNTGVGKTDILHSLKQLGCSILDLEGAANHRGSILGSVCIGKCNSQKRFESNIYAQLMNAKDKYVFVEAESKKIGSVSIPSVIADKMKQGIQIFIDADISTRISNLKRDYILNDNWQAESIKAMDYFKKYISNDNIEMFKQEITKGNFDFVASELIEKYYDPLYSYKSSKLDYTKKFEYNTNINDITNDIYNWYKKM